MSSNPTTIKTEDFDDLFHPDPHTLLDVEDINKAFNKFNQSKGPYITPGSAYLLQSKINTLAEDDAIVIMPGVYTLNKPLRLTRPIRLIGSGRVVIEFDKETSAIIVDEWTPTNSGNKYTPHTTVIKNICFRPKTWSSFSSLTTPVINVRSGANSTQIMECCFTARRDNVVKVATANQVSVSNCSFHGGTASGGADIYYEDSALRGIVFGNLWSTTRSHVLSYKTGTNMSEAANGPAAIVQVRP